MINKLIDCFIAGISLLDEQDQQMDDKEHLLSGSEHSALHSICSQINQIPSESDASLEELMAQMKSI